MIIAISVRKVASTIIIVQICKLQHKMFAIELRGDSNAPTTLHKVNEY